MHWKIQFDFLNSLVHILSPLSLLVSLSLTLLGGYILCAIIWPQELSSFWPYTSSIINSSQRNSYRDTSYDSRPNWKIADSFAPSAERQPTTDTCSRVFRLYKLSARDDAVMSGAHRRTCARQPSAGNVLVRQNSLANSIEHRLLDWDSQTANIRLQNRTRSTKHERPRMPLKVKRVRSVLELEGDKWSRRSLVTRYSLLRHTWIFLNTSIRYIQVDEHMAE